MEIGVNYRHCKVTRGIIDTLLDPVVELAEILKIMKRKILFFKNHSLSGKGRHIRSYYLVIELLLA